MERRHSAPTKVNTGYIIPVRLPWAGSSTRRKRWQVSISSQWISVFCGLTGVGTATRRLTLRSGEHDSPKATVLRDDAIVLVLAGLGPVRPKVEIFAADAEESLAAGPMLPVFWQRRREFRHGGIPFRWPKRYLPFCAAQKGRTAERRQVIANPDFGLT